MQQTAYFENPQTPGRRYFNCPSGFGMLSVEACAQRHKLGKCVTCRICATGACHAGTEPRLDWKGDDYKHRCCHCLNHTRRTSHGLCDACYVRLRPGLTPFSANGKVVNAARLTDALVRLAQHAAKKVWFGDCDLPMPCMVRKPRKPRRQRLFRRACNPRLTDLWTNDAGASL